MTVRNLKPPHRDRPPLQRRVRHVRFIKVAYLTWFTLARQPRYSCEPDRVTGFVMLMGAEKTGYVEGGRNTDTGNIGSCGIERNWISELRRRGLQGSGNVEGEEKSSETGSDFVSTSAVSRPISVTGTPSICVTTQMHSKMMRHATPLVQ